MSGGNGGVNFMEISKSSHSDTRMAVDGSSPNTLMDFTVEEKIETKEWVSNPGIASVQQEELCQDDIFFSFAELSGQPEQVVIETTINTETTTETGNDNVNIVEGGVGPAVEMNTGNSLVDLEANAQVSSLLSQPQEEHIINTAVEQSMPGSTDQIDARNAIDVSTYGSELDEESENPPNMFNEDAAEHGIKTIKKLPNMLTEARDAFDTSTGDKDQKESVQLNHFIPDNSQNVENVSTINAVSTTQEDQPHLNQPETKQLESFCGQKQPETAVDLKEEQVSHQKEPGFEALKGMEDCQKQPEIKAASDISTGDKDEKELVQFNQVTLDNSQHVENVSTTLAVSRVVENQPHLNQPGLETLNEKKEDCHQKQPEMETMKVENGSCQYLEEMPSTAQAGGGVDDKSEVNDNKVSTSDGQLPSTQFENMLQEMPVYKTTEESKEIEATAPGHLGSDREDFASDLNCPLQELRENMQSENAPQNTSILANLESNPALPQGECNAEPIEYREVEESENIPKEFESLKGRKVSKRFKKKKYLGEVIGYDSETKWFKVLYEDGDEEEFEKEELDCILLPVGDAKASVSRKRRLSTDDDEHKKANGSAKKSRKLDTDGTPGKSRKFHTAEDQTPLSQQASETKKKKSTVARGKSKSSKTNTPKTQTSRKKGSSAKKTMEKKGSAKSSHTKSKKKPKSPKKQSVGKIIQDSAKQHSSVTKSLKFDSAKKKTPTKLKKASQDSPGKDKITRSGRTVRVPNKSLKARSVATDADDKAEVQKVSTAEKSEVHTPRRKRKLESDIQGGLSTVDVKRVKKTKTVNDLATPLGSSMKSRNIVEDAKLQISHEKTYDAEFQVQLNDEKAESSVPLSTGNRRGKTDRGSVLVGRKVKKDFGGELFGGVVVGYKAFYRVKYDDGDSEELTWKELESILLLDEGSPQNKNEEKQSVKSKSKQKKVYKGTHTDVTHLIHFEL